jgi:copper(I)-binding protein
MFMGLKGGLKEGASFPATLQFEKAGTVQVQFSVQGMGASSAAPAGGGHGHHRH